MLTLIKKLSKSIRSLGGSFGKTQKQNELTLLYLQFIFYFDKMTPTINKPIKTVTRLAIFLFLQTSFGQTLNDCFKCKTQLIKKEQVKDLNADNIRLLTNEIFARNGYMFENSRFQEYFENKAWYKSIGDNKKIVLNDTEKKNIAFLKEITKTLEDQKKELTSQLKNFKELVNQDKTNELKGAFNFGYEKNNSEEKKSLKEVFSKINLDDINYYKNKGMFKTTEDNGFVQIEYMVYIENDEITISYNYMTHSKIIDNFDEYTDYHSENEFSYNWQFKFSKNKLNYIRLAVAG